MLKVRSKGSFAIGLLVLGVFVAGGFLLQSALGVPSFSLEPGGGDNFKDKYESVDDTLPDVSLYLCGYRWDENDTRIGWVCVAGGASLVNDQGVQRIYYYGSASVGVFSNSPEGGSGEAWVSLLDRPIAHDANPNGNVDLPPGLSADAWDSALRDINQVGEGTAEAYAELSLTDVSISARIDASGL